MFQLIPNDHRSSPPFGAPIDKRNANHHWLDFDWPAVLRWVLVGLIFMALTAFLIHSASAVNQDLGRHLKLGQLILQTGKVPHTNLFSFTNPDFPFINHHWLSEVIYYLLSLIVGIKGLIIFNALVILAAFALIWRLAWRKDYFVSSSLAAMLGAGLMLERTDIGPETFGFLLFALFLFILDKNKERISRSFWLLVPLEFLWVNLHISFIYGLALIFFFFLDRLWTRRRAVYILARQKKLDRYMAQVILLGLLAGAVVLANPGTWRGALYPFYIFSNYGYPITENQSPLFLEQVMYDPAIIFFKVALAAIVVSFLFNWRKIRPLHLFLSLFFVAVSWLAARNLPLLGLAIIPALSFNFVSARERYAKYFARWERIRLRAIARPLTIAIIFVILIGSIYAAASNRFYLGLIKNERFGLNIPAGAGAAIDFLKQNKVAGPMFNNFDIGSYLVWKAWPDYKIFVDGRPEAYPSDFFQSVYIPMQTNDEAWKKYADDTYGINFVFFAHTDGTPWGREFMKLMAQRKGWAMVYLDPEIVIWVRDNQANKPLILKYALKQENLSRYIEKYLAGDNFFDLACLGSFFQTAGFNELAIASYNGALELNPSAKQIWLLTGMLYGGNNDARQGENYFKKAIKLDDNYIEAYLSLGKIYYQEGDFSEARRTWQKILEIDPGNKEARTYLDNMGLIPFKK